MAFNFLPKKNMQNYFTSVYYGNKTYNTTGGNLLSTLTPISRYSKNIKDDGEHEVAAIAKYYEEGDLLILKLGKLLFNVKDLNFDGFTELWEDSINFNTKTLEGCADLEICNKYNHLPFDDLCLLDISAYLSGILKNNAQVEKYIESNLATLYVGLNHYNYSNQNKNQLALMNVLRLTTTNLIEIEKMISSENHRLLELVFKRKDGKLEKGKKINQVFDMPKFAIDYIKENQLENAEEHIRLISEEFDGNTIRIVFDMFDNFKSYNRDEKNQRYGTSEFEKKREFIEIIYETMKKGYKITTLLNYLLKQRMYWSKDKSFNIPFEEARLMKDFLKICNEYSLKCEKYPQNLSKMHDIVIKNVSVLKDADRNKEFIDSVLKYHTSDIEIDDFVFTSPKDIHDLVKEGNDLHHCIGSYVDNICKGVSEIYFMRRKNKPNESFVTVELSPLSKKIVEFKEDYNKEPTDATVIDVIKKFEKTKTKKTTTTK